MTQKNDSENEKLTIFVGFLDLCFVHPIFSSWFLVTFGDKVTKIQKYYVIFVYILQGKIGKTKKTERKSQN